MPNCRGTGQIKPTGLGLPYDCPGCPSCTGKPHATAKLKPREDTRKRRAQPIGHASPPQRAKVQREGKCRHCGADKHIAPLDPAHIVGRDMGGCDSEHCVLCLCRICHRRQEEGDIDVLPYLTHLEQAHGVSHVGAVQFLHLATGERWWPESARAAA